MNERAPRDTRGFLAAGLGTLIGGTGTYLAIALISPFGITTAQFLTFDHGGELELEGIFVMFAVLLAGAIAIAGCWTGLWLQRYRFGFLTAFIATPLLFSGSRLIMKLQSEAGYYDTARVYGFALLLCAWPFLTGIISRGAVILAARQRSVRPAGTRSRLERRRAQ